MNSRAVDEIDIAGCAAIAYSSENPAHPVEHLLDGRSDAAKLAAVDSGLVTGNAAARPPSPPADWTVLNVDTLRDDDWGRTVRYGRDLITKTYALIGPEVADASHRYSGNNLACESCHLEAGTKKFGLPFQGVYADFPNYRAVAMPQPAIRFAADSPVEGFEPSVPRLES